MSGPNYLEQLLRRCLFVWAAIAAAFGVWDEMVKNLSTSSQPRDMIPFSVWPYNKESSQHIIDNFDVLTSLPTNEILI